MRALQSSGQSSTSTDPFANVRGGNADPNTQFGNQLPGTTPVDESGWNPTDYAIRTTTSGADLYGKVANFVEVVGTDGTKNAFEIVEDLRDGATVTEGGVEIASRVSSGFADGIANLKASPAEIRNWLTAAANGNVNPNGVGQSLTKIFGSNSDEIVKNLTKFGGNVVDGIGKIAGPLAHVSNAITVYDAISADPNSLVGSDSTSVTWQIINRVVVDVGGGLVLDVLTGDVIGAASDSTAIVFKSIADVERTLGLAINTLDDQALTDADYIEIQSGQYARTKDYVDANLPTLLGADSDRTGRDWSTVNRNSPNLPFTWDEVEAKGAISTEAAEKLSENNFRLALLRFLQGRNPGVIDDRPKPDTGPGPEPEPQVQTDPPVPDTPPRPDRPDEPGQITEPPLDQPPEPGPGPTGTVTPSTDPRITPPDTGGGDGTPPTTLGGIKPNGKKPTKTPGTQLPPGIFLEPREGWHNEYAYDADGNWIGYRPEYPLAPTRTEGDSYDDLFAGIDKELEDSEIGATSELSDEQLAAIYGNDDGFDLDKYQTEKLQRLKDERLRKEQERLERMQNTSFSNIEAVKFDPVTFDPVTFDPVKFDPVTWDPPKWDPPQWEPPVWVPPTFDAPEFSGFQWTDFADDDWDFGGQVPSFSFGNMSGQVATDLSRWEEWLATQDRRLLERLARQAGYPNLASALADFANLMRDASDTGWRQWALAPPSCTGYVGCGPQYLERWTAKRSRLALGDLLNADRDFFSSAGLSDVQIMGLFLRFIISDFGLEDGDIVNVVVTQFGQTLFNQTITTTNAGTAFEIAVRKGVVSVVMTAVNTGDIPPNTAALEIQNVSSGEEDQNYSLDTGETAGLKVTVGG